MGVTVVTSIEEFNEIINRDRIAIVDFWAAWCGPCSTISPIFEKLSETFKEIDFYKVNVDEHEDIADKAGINAMPTFMVFKKGQKTKELVASNPSAVTAMVAATAQADST